MNRQYINKKEKQKTYEQKYQTIYDQKKHQETKL